MFSIFKLLKQGQEAVLDALNRLEAGQHDIHHSITLNSLKVEKIMADLGAIDTAITTLGNEVGNLVNAYQSALTKGQNQGVDFSSEVAQLNAIGTKITDALSSASGAAVAPDVPQPGATATTPTDTTSTTGTSTAEGATSTAPGESVSTGTETSISLPDTSTSPSASEPVPTEANTSPHS